MKQLISLLLIISITIISWSSCAKNTIIEVNSVYVQPLSAMNSMILKPSVTNQHINEGFGVTSNQLTHKSHNFFELAIIFNEKLQQFLAFFTNLSDTVEEITSSDLSSASVSTSNMTSSNDNQETIQKCKASS
jgi:hypothetical protein